MISRLFIIAVFLSIIPEILLGAYNANNFQAIYTSTVSTPGTALYI